MIYIGVFYMMAKNLVNIKNFTNNKIQTQNSIFCIINILLISYITISSIFPPLRVLTPSAIINAICMAFWLMLTFLYSMGFYINATVQRFLTILFIIYSFLVPYIFGNVTVGNRYLGIAPIFFLYIVYEYNNYIGQPQNNFNIIKITIPFALITLIITGTGLRQNPLLSRSIKSSGEYSVNLLKRGIAGYEFIYFLVLLFPIIMYITFFSSITKKRYQKCLLILCCILIFSVIILSNYFTALIVSLSSLLIMIIVRVTKKNKPIAMIVGLILICIFVIIGKEIVLFILDWMATWVGNSLTLQRIYEMKYSIIFGNDSIVNTNRWDLMRVSINSFLNNSIIGIIANPKINFLDFYTGTGQHSHFIDTFAFLGLLPGLMQIYIVVQPYFKRLKQGFANDLILAVLYSIIMIFTFNTVTPSMGIVTGLLLPMLYDALKQKDKVN